MADELKQREREFEAEAARINAGRKPKFGDLMRNPWASETNPIRDGYFVRKCGEYYEFTDRRGKFWQTRAKFAFFIDDSRAAPADLDAEGLPPLKEPRWKAWDFEKWAPVWTDSEVRQAQRDAIAADRRAREDADTARLDFMIREECQIETMDRPGAAPLYRVCWPHQDTDMREWSATGREAIDAAMRAREGTCGS